jgi:polyisoprenoid-binding protein YceI
VNRRFLQVLGFLALVALVLGSLAALIAVRSRLEITIAGANDAGARGPDPVVLLEEGLSTLQSDVRALGQGLQAVHDGLDEAAAQRDAALRAELQSLHLELQALRAVSDGVQQSALAIRAGLDRPEDQVAGSSASEVPGLDAGSGLQMQFPERSGVLGAPSAPEPSAEVSRASPTAPQTKAPAHSFLAFQLPSRAFAFDRAQRLEVLPSLSRVGFDAKSTLHDFSGATSAVKGHLQTCLAEPSRLCRGTLIVEASALDTGEAGRDEAMREHLAASDHPQIRFEWTAFEAEAVDAQAMTVRGTARGRMSVRGVERDFAMPVRVAVDESRRVAIDGEAPLDLEDFGVPVPSKLGVISMQSEVTVWIALRLRAIGPATEEVTRVH